MTVTRGDAASSADDGFGAELKLELANDMDPAGAAMDRVDLRILSDLLAIYDATDPMPEMLPDLVLFGLNVHDLDAEFARLVESELAESGVSGTRSVEHARRVTFASDSLTVMVVVNPQLDGSVRLDGWAAPGGRLHAELRVGESTMTAECDESGRFVFDSVPAGPAQLVLHPTMDSDPSLTLPVVTPAVHL
ncbi:MAG: carboxypeptidase regulatory-like domain-containing protein [Nakamurella sp.]